MFDFVNLPSCFSKMAVYFIFPAVPSCPHPSQARLPAFISAHTLGTMQYCFTVFVLFVFKILSSMCEYVSLGGDGMGA